MSLSHSETYTKSRVALLIQRRHLSHSLVWTFSGRHGRNATLVTSKWWAFDVIDLLVRTEPWTSVCLAPKRFVRIVCIWSCAFLALKMAIFRCKWKYIIRQPRLQLTKRIKILCENAEIHRKADISSISSVSAANHVHDCKSWPLRTLNI